MYTLSLLLLLLLAFGVGQKRDQMVIMPIIN